MSPHIGSDTVERGVEMTGLFIIACLAVVFGIAAIVQGFRKGWFG